MKNQHYYWSKYFFESLAEVVLQLARRDKLGMVFSLDETLLTSEKGKAATEIRAALKLLSENLKTHVAVVSSLAVVELRQILDAPTVICVGYDGLEIEGPSFRFLHPSSERCVLLVAKACEVLVQSPQTIEWGIVERRGIVGRVNPRPGHEQRFDEVRHAMIEAMAPFEETLCVTESVQGLAIRPRVAWGRTAAVRWILDQIEPDEDKTIYVGDGQVDEDSFKALVTAVTIRVGMDAMPTAARFYLKDSDEVVRLMRHLRTIQNVSFNANT